MTTIYEHAGKKYRLADQRDIGKVINGSDICFEKAMQNSVDTLIEYLPHKALGRYIGKDCRTGGEYYWKFAFIELTKEELQALYTERQAAWVAENDVKPGTKVRVTRTAKSYEDGWGDYWMGDMDKYVGKKLTVNRTDGSSMHLLTGDEFYCWNFPYFVLEVVKEPQWRLMGPEEIIGPDCRYTAFEDDVEEPLDAFCGGWVSLLDITESHGLKVKDAKGYSKLYATQRPLPAAQAEVPPPPAGYEVVPESEYASYVPQSGDYFLGGMSNAWIPITCYDSYTCEDLRSQCDLKDPLYAGFARRISVVASQPEAPEGWRWLTDDEIIQKGDSYWSKRRAVEDAVPDLVHSTIGNTYGKLKASSHWSHIWGVLRKVEPVVAERPKVEEKPDLWRLLGDDEIVQEGDWVNSTRNPWSVSDLKQDSLPRLGVGWVSSNGAIGRKVSEYAGGLVAVRRIGVESKHQPKPTYEEMVKALAKPGQTIASEMTADDAHLMHMAIGVSGEAGELLDAVKKAVIYRKALDRVNVVEELGDLEFYMEGLRQGLGINREECLKANMEKLSVRYGQKYSDQAATVRADKEQS